VRIKTKVEIQMNTDGTWEVLRFLSGPTKQVKLGLGETPIQDALDRAGRIKHQRRHNWGKTKRGRSHCSICGMVGKNMLTCLAWKESGKRVHRGGV